MFVIFMIFMIVCIAGLFSSSGNGRGNATSLAEMDYWIERERQIATDLEELGDEGAQIDPTDPSDRKLALNWLARMEEGLTKRDHAFAQKVRVFGELQHLLPPAVAADMRQGLVDLEERLPKSWRILANMRADLPEPVELVDDVCPRRRQLAYTASVGRA
jgi:hypothetical protein